MTETQIGACGVLGLGWLLWAVMVRRVQLEAAPRLIRVDYYGSTALLSVATFFVAAGQMVSDALPLRVLGGIVAVGVLFVLARSGWRDGGQAATLHAQTEPAPRQWKVRGAPATPPRPGCVSSSRTVQGIESMEVQP